MNDIDSCLPLTFSRQLPLWEMESQWTLKTSKSNFKDQNSMACDVPYIIGKLSLYFTWYPSPLGITWTSTIPCWQAPSSMHLLQLSYWKYPNKLIMAIDVIFDDISTTLATKTSYHSLSSTIALPYSWPIKKKTRWRLICLGSKIIDIMLWVFP